MEGKLPSLVDQAVKQAEERDIRKVGKKLKQVYDVDVVVKADEKIKPGKFEIEILKTYN